MIAAGTFFSLKDAPQVDLPLPAVTAEAPQTTRYLTKSIEDLRPISDRVLADNPEIDGPAQTQFEQIDEKNLRLLTLNLTKPDGTEMEAVIAQSIPWIHDVLLSNNGQVPIGTKELGAGRRGCSLTVNHRGRRELRARRTELCVPLRNLR